MAKQCETIEGEYESGTHTYYLLLHTVCPTIPKPMCPHHGPTCRTVMEVFIDAERTERIGKVHDAGIAYWVEMEEHEPGYGKLIPVPNPIEGKFSIVNLHEGRAA